MVWRGWRFEKGAYNGRQLGGIEMNLLKDLKGEEEFPPILPNCYYVHLII